MWFQGLITLFLLKTVDSLTQYYIEKQLLLHYKNKHMSKIVIDKQIGTFYLPLFDGDEQILNEVSNDYLSAILKPRKQPKTIFKWKRFLSSNWQEKYSVIVDEKLKHNKKKWEDLDEIVKIEVRYVNEEYMI